MAFVDISPVCDQIAREKFRNLLNRNYAASIAEQKAMRYFAVSENFSFERTPDKQHPILLDRGIIKDRPGRVMIYVSQQEYELFLHVELTQLQQQLGD